jgi:polysaccharide biosynthesis transport protein
MSDNLPKVQPLEIVESGERALAHGNGGRSLGPYADDAGGEPDSPGFRRHLAAVLRYKWVILGLVVLGTTGGVLVSRTAVMEYEAEATVWIETTSREGDRTGPIRPAELLQSSGWIELLRSYQVLDPVVLEKQLYLTSARADAFLFEGLALDDRMVPGTYRLRVGATGNYTLETPSGVVVEQGVAGRAVGSTIGLIWTPSAGRLGTDRTIDFTVQSPRDVARSLSRRLTAELDRNGNFLRVRLKGPDPEATTAVLNHVTERYVDVAADLRRVRLEELVSILGEQLSYAEQNLRESEIALEGFRVQTVTLPADRSTPVTPGLQATRDPVFTSYFEMRIELEQFRRSQDAIRRAVDPDADQGLALQALEAIDAVQRSSELTGAIQELTLKKADLRALMYRYTAEHPPVARLMNDIAVLERRTIPAMTTALLGELEARERQLEQRIAGASSELRAIPPRMIEEARLTRAVAIADDLYTTLQRSYEEARLAAVSSVPDIRVLDPAVVPRQPVGGGRQVLILFGFAGALALGIAGAILRDRLDSRLRYPEQVTDMGLTILAALPSLRTRRGILVQESRTQAEEAFRTLRLNLTYAHGTAGPLVTTITSPGPGDGKSFVTANLGMFFASMGRRTLVIDGDIRRGTLHHLLEVDRVPGLTEYLRGTLPTAPVRASRHENLWVLTSGSRMKDGPDLLGSPAMRDLLQGVRGEYDVILVDSPPMGAGVDPFALGTLTGNMLLVLRTGTTDRELADSKLEVLDRLPIRVLGAVLNGVPQTREYRYYSYVSGYGVYDAPGREAGLALPGAASNSR